MCGPEKMSSAPRPLYAMVLALSNSSFARTCTSVGSAAVLPSWCPADDGGFALLLLQVPLTPEAPVEVLKPVTREHENGGLDWLLGRMGRIVREQTRSERELQEKTLDSITCLAG